VIPRRIRYLDLITLDNLSNDIDKRRRRQSDEHLEDQRGSTARKSNRLPRQISQVLLSKFTKLTHSHLMTIQRHTSLALFLAADMNPPRPPIRSRLPSFPRPDANADDLVNGWMNMLFDDGLFFSSNLQVSFHPAFFRFPTTTTHAHRTTMRRGFGRPLSSPADNL
jgi:hypothetical protein